MKTKILTFLKGTQKATGALLGAAGVLGSMTFLAEPYGRYVAIASVVLTWVATYFLPYVSKTVETFPDEIVHEGEIVEPETVEIPVQYVDTVGIPLIEQKPEPDTAPVDYSGMTVDEIIARLDAERATV